jgi:hypothetical protein
MFKGGYLPIQEYENPISRLLSVNLPISPEATAKTKKTVQEEENIHRAQPRDEVSQL